MSPAATKRKLAAILSADVVGYSRLMAEDEEATVRKLTAYRDQIGALVREHRGRLIDFSGDNFLAEFPTALNAAECAVEIQRVLAARNADLAPEQKMEFRIGVHLGDIRVEGKRIYGDGVNIAARLEGLAEPGGICVSASVHEQVESKLGLGFEDLGEQSVKNIPRPIRTYRVRPEGVRAGPARATGTLGRRLRGAALVAGAVVLFVSAGLWLSWPRPMGWALDIVGLGGLPVNPPLPDKPSLVVLPFANMSGDPEQEYFADGMTEDLTTSLAGSTSLFVISRNSAFTYKGKTLKVEDIGRELGVRYVLEGSVQRAGGRVRITAQLIDATTGFHLWSERYDRDLKDIFALQSEISEKIMAETGAEINEAELNRIRRKPTDNLTAYELLLKGTSHLFRLRREDNAEARRLLEQAITLDPEFADAYAALGATYNAEYGLDWNLDRRLLDRAAALARKALELDPLLPAGYSALGYANLFSGRVPEAIENAKRAIELAPNYYPPHGLLGFALGQEGDLVGALQSVRRALRLDPRSPSEIRMMISILNFQAGRYQEAVGPLEQIRADNPDNIIARIVLAGIYESEGNHEKASLIAQEILEVNPDLTVERIYQDTVTTGMDPNLLRRAGLP